MQRALWVLLGAGAILWPSRLSGPLDGVPLDQPAEVFLFGVGLPLLVLLSPSSLRRTSVRAAVLALAAWKVVGAAALVQDGWCVRFETPAPLYKDMGLVPRSWDARAGWMAAEPACSAVVDRPYERLEEFPIWFYNLPPASDHAASDADRPPLVRLRMTVSGVLTAAAPGVLRIDTGRGMQTALSVNGSDRGAVRDAEFAIEEGAHAVTTTSTIEGGEWRFSPQWNGRSLWPQSIATLEPQGTIDRLVRPWGRFVPLLLVGVLTMALAIDTVRATGPPIWLQGGAAIAVFASLGRMAGSFVRIAPAILVLAAWLAPASLRNRRGFLLLVAAPWLAWFGVRAASEAAVVMFYTSGDDWWMFQRYAYRIFMQGYWLEGGQPTFWFQPLYRWIAGALHMIFGDASSGELVWDAWCALAGGAFAFVAVRAIVGVRWGLVAAVTTLTLFTLGPAWYLFGRGLAEISSMGFLYASALLLVRDRGASAAPIAAAGVLATLAFLARMNNLPAVFAVIAFAVPLGVPVADLWRPRAWVPQVSKPVVAAVLVALGAGMWFLTWRAYHFTGVLDMLHGTQAGALGVWQHTTEGLTPFQNVVGSVLMVLTMNDPPRLDPRAVPLVFGVAVALLGVLGVPGARRLPLSLTVFCLAAMSGSLIARGTAYPGRFSVHIIPAAVALAVCIVARAVEGRRGGAA